MKALVLYSSLTGNTKKIADAIYEAIPVGKDIFKVDENYNLDEYNLIAIGYWVDKGICDSKTKELIEKLNNKDIILFGTLGAADEGRYYESVKLKIEKMVPDSNKILGHFLCQGKINEKVSAKYEELLKKDPENEHIKEQLKNHEEASSHPDEEDIGNSKNFIINIFNK